MQMIRQHTVYLFNPAKEGREIALLKYNMIMLEYKFVFFIILLNPSFFFLFCSIDSFSYS